MNLENGSQISHYKILRKIASGGMGEIYLAEDLKLNRQVALKVLSDEFASEDVWKKQIINEARAAAKIEHQNIVTIHEIIEEYQTPVIVMEYIQGKTLDEVLHDRNLPVEKIIDIIKQICSALERLHKNNIIHRDIKSSNIVIDDQGKVCIIDFGLSNLPDVYSEDVLSASSGTLGYLSPEQVKGEPTTEQSDLFSLGVLFYHALSGKMPFDSDYEAAVRYAILNEEPPKLSIDDRLEKIVFKLLEKSPAKRYQTATEVLDDLSELDSKSSTKTKEGIYQSKYIVSFVALIVIVLGVFGVMKYPFNEIKSGTISLAVLPFENIGITEDTLLADGITDALTNNLGKINNIRVISKRSTDLYKNSDEDLSTIGDELSVSYLLTGTIHWDKQSRGNIRIYTALVDVDNDVQVWNGQYDLNIKEYFTVLTTISAEVVSEMHLVLSDLDRKDITTVPKITSEAYNLYVRGNGYFQQSWEKKDIEFAKQLYREAIAIDSNFAEAHAMLSRCYSSSYWEYYNHTQDICSRAKFEAEKSLVLQPDNAEGLEALGYYFYHCENNYDSALAIFSYGINKHLNSPDLYNAIAAVLRIRNEYEQSVTNFKHAFKLDPLSHLKAFDIALTYGMAGQYDSSAYYGQKALSLAPDFALGRLYMIWLPIIRNGDTKEATKRLVNARKITDLTSSKYYWWLLRTLDIDDKPHLNQMTPSTDSIAYYSYVMQYNRLRHNNNLERIYADSLLNLAKRRLKEYPDDARFNSAAGLAYAGLKNYDKALFYGEKIIQSSKVSFDTPFLLLDYAEICLISGKKDVAQRILQQVQSISGFFSDNYFSSDPLWKDVFIHNKSADSSTAL